MFDGSMVGWTGWDVASFLLPRVIYRGVVPEPWQVVVTLRDSEEEDKAQG
jgi:predicted sugar kinase